MQYFNGREIPEKLCKTVVSESLVTAGIYDGHYHRFLAKGFQPTDSTLRKVKEEAEKFGFEVEDSSDIIREILNSVNTEGNDTHIATVILSGENELPLLSLIEFQEENNGVTELIYLGNKKFYVLTTTRSTLMPGNLVVARTIPMNRGQIWEFDIYKSFSASKPSVPDGYKKYKAWFKTTTVNSVILHESSQFFSVIDSHEKFGGHLEELSVNGAEYVIESLINDIQEVIQKLNDDELPYNRQFPDYDKLIGASKKLGVKTFLLNHIIESLERREQFSYILNDNDWHVYKTKEQIEEEKRELEKKNRRRYQELKKSLEAELQKIKRRKVALLFDAPGVITEESKAYLKPIKDELEALAELGFGTKGYADTEIRTALDNSKPRPKHNLRVAAIIAGALVLALFVAFSWMTASRSVGKFDEEAKALTQLLDNEKFNDAKAQLVKARSEFKPSYLRFIISRKVSLCENQIEDSIDSFVESRVEQAQILMRANKGRIDEYTWGLIVEAMEFRPEDESLNELRDKYISQ